MFKITAVIALLFIAVVSVWASCDSCGSECAPACGTRRFRACCFNYLRKKRGPDTLKVHMLSQDIKESQSRSKMPMYVDDMSVSEQQISNGLPGENYPYLLKDMVGNHLY